MKKILIVVCAALLVGVSAKGQDAASVAMDFSAVQRSPKALGMGGTDAFDAVSSRLVSGKKLFDVCLMLVERERRHKRRDKIRRKQIRIRHVKQSVFSQGNHRHDKTDIDHQ